jgi:hypothetical protein
MEGKSVIILLNQKFATPQVELTSETLIFLWRQAVTETAVREMVPNLPHSPDDMKYRPSFKMRAQNFNQAVLLLQKKLHSFFETEMASYEWPDLSHYVGEEDVIARKTTYFWNKYTKIVTLKVTSLGDKEVNLLKIPQFYSNWNYHEAIPIVDIAFNMVGNCLVKAPLHHPHIEKRDIYLPCSSPEERIDFDKALDSDIDVPNSTIFLYRSRVVAPLLVDETRSVPVVLAY